MKEIERKRENRETGNTAGGSCLRELNIGINEFQLND